LLFELKPALIKSLIARFSCSDPFPNEASSFAFLFQAFDHHLLTAAEILPIVRQIASDSRFLQSACWLLVYCAPELEATDPALTSDLIGRLQLNSSRKLLPHVFITFSDGLDRFRRDGWGLLRACRNFFRESPGIVSRMLEDNVSALEAFAAAAGVSLLTRLPTWACFPSMVLLRRPTLIQSAAFLGGVNCFRWLLSNGSDIYVNDSRNMTLAQAAVAGGNIEIVRICQQYELDFSGTADIAIRYHRNELFEWLYGQGSQNADSLFRASCEWNNAHALRKLAPEADVNSISSDGHWTALGLAIWRGNHGCIRYLLSLPGINVNLLDPLALAVERGDVGAARLLLDGGTRVVDAPYMEIAVRTGHIGIVEFLLTIASVDPNACTPGGASPFVRAARGGHEAMALALGRDRRVDVNNSFPDNIAPLFWAIRREFLSVVETLLARPDLDLSARMPSGCTFLHYAARQGSMLPLFLARGGIDVNATDSAGETPLHKAAFAGNVRAVVELLALPQTDVNAVGERGSPLACAFAARQPATALALIGCGRVRTDGPPPAITFAIACDFAECVRALAARSDCDVGSALSVAARHGRSEMIAILLARSPRRERIKQALAVATRLGFADCGQLLKDAITGEKRVLWARRRTV
jgi:ankyrin repeat protein